MLDILCVESLEDLRDGRTSLFFDDSVASERVKSDNASILKTKLSDFQVGWSVFLEREFLLKCLEFC